MDLDLMTGGGTWPELASLARDAKDAGISGLVITETGSTPWMGLAAAVMAAPELEYSTGIAVAFARSPMVSAQLAWELAHNTGGRFRLGLGSQVQAHIERRYGAAFSPPGPRLQDYVAAVRACFRAFSGTEKLSHHGPYYDLSLLTTMFAPAPLPDGVAAPKVDISAVGPWMLRMAGETADGIHVHPFHSMRYLHEVLIPAVAQGAARAARSAADVDLLVPVFTIVGDDPETRAPLKAYVKQQVGLYGSTKNYAQQFDLLGFEGTSARLNERLKVGDVAGMAELITDEMLDAYAVTCRWDELADLLIARYQGVARRLVMYCYERSLKIDRANVGRWGEVARAVRAAA